MLATRVRPLADLGTSHDQLERHTEAIHAFRKALDNENKNEARILNNLGIILGKQQKWPEAVRALKEAEEADPTFPETHVNLLHIYT